jgi:hypothetical protein
MLAPVLSELRECVCDVATKFDATALDAGGATVALREWTQIAHAADAAMALAAARVAECDVPDGEHDAANFIARQTGTTSAKAKERIKRGDDLLARPKTRNAATTGLLSPDQASAIADAAQTNPDAEDDLLDAAGRSSVGQLRDTCAKRKAEREDREAIERRIHTNRHIRRWRDPDGAEHLHAVGTKRDMSIIDQALKQQVDQRFKQARRDGVREPLEAYAFDALVALADGSVALEKKDPIRNLAILRLDLSALVRGHPEDGEVCEISGLGPVSMATARAMLGESVLKLVITNGVDVRNVTHLGRGPNTAQKIALLWEQAVCQREGCGRRLRLEDDHKHGCEYRRTKHTRVDETDALCDDDHNLKSLHGWALVEGTGIRPMVPPDDARHPDNTCQGRGP